MKKVVLTFGLLILALLILFQLGKFSFFTLGRNSEMMIAVFGLVFIAFGLVISKFILTPARSRNMEQPKETLAPESIDELGISQREYEVLLEIAKGLSNQEIAERLFIAESTVKSHVSSLLIKLDAKRRTQAVTNARKMGIL